MSVQFEAAAVPRGLEGVSPGAVIYEARANGRNRFVTAGS
jgi:hypothetical protein